MYMTLWLNIGLGTRENPGGNGPVGLASSSSDPDDTRASSCFTDDGVDVGAWSFDLVVKDRGPGGLPGGHGDGDVDYGKQIQYFISFHLLFYISNSILNFNFESTFKLESTLNQLFNF